MCRHIHMCIHVHTHTHTHTYTHTLKEGDAACFTRSPSTSRCGDRNRKKGRELCVCVCVCFLLLLDENARPPIRRIDSQLEHPDPLCAHGDDPFPAHCELRDPARHPRLHGFPPSIPQENHLIMRRRDEVLAVEEPGACAHTLAVSSEGDLQKN